MALVVKKKKINKYLENLITLKIITKIFLRKIYNGVNAARLKYETARVQ